MAGYLSTQFQDYGGGELANALDFVGWNQKRKANEQMLQNQKLNEQMALEDLMTTQQKRPLELERSRLDNAGLEALLPEKQVKGKMAERDWEVEQGIPLEQRRQAILSKLAREVQEDELKRYESEIKRMISDPMVLRNPNAKAIAEQFYSILPEIRKMREGFDSKEDLAKLRADVEREKQTAISERATETARIRAKEKSTLDAMIATINKQKGPGDRLRTVQTYLSMLAEDDPRRMTLQSLETQFMAQFNAEQRARTAGKQIFNAETGQLESPSGITLEPRQGAAKPDPLGIR